MDSEDSDQTGRMPRLIGVFIPFCWFCHETAQLLISFAVPSISLLGHCDSKGFNEKTISCLSNLASPVPENRRGKYVTVILAFLNEFYINYCLHSVLVFLVFICWFQNKTPKESYLMIVK